MENCERVARYVGNLNRDAWERDERTRDAVERCMERVCEAATRLGDAAGDLMPDQPWGAIRGMGNRLRHGYDRLDVDILWDVVQTDLPSLAAAARASRDAL